MLGSLRSRLICSFAAVVAVSVLVASLSLVALLRDYSSRLLQARLDDIAMGMVFQAREMVRLGNTPESILSYLQDQARTFGVRLLLVDRAGVVVREAGDGPSLLGARIQLQPFAPPSSEPQLPRQAPIGRFRAPRSGDSYLFAAVPSALANRVGETPRLLVAQVEGSPLSTLGFLIQRLLLAAAIGLAAALLASFLLARWLSEPLLHLFYGTRAVASGEYGRRVPVEGPREIARVSESFNQMAAEVERSRSIVQRFVSTLSHELRSPLTSIRGFAQAVLDGSASEPDEVQRAMRIVDREAARMQRLAAELLDFSRLQAGQIVMRQEPVDLAELARHCADVLAGKAEERNVAIVVSLPPAMPTAGDNDRLEQVFTNIVDNAVKFTPPGGAVTVAGGEDERGYRVEVRNPGAPIPPEELPRIFEAYYSGARGRERGGVGLGLAISREIVRAHHGEVGVSSGAGGTSLSVWLPRLAVSTPEAPTQPALTLPPAAHSRTTGP